jgi:protein-disulfide isomerase
VVFSLLTLMINRRRWSYLLSLSVLVVLLSACDQADDASDGAKLSPQQINERIQLQKQLAAAEQTQNAADVRFTEVRQRLSRLRSENQGRFIDDEIEVGALAPLGAAKAPVAIVAFNDFECSACAAHVAGVLPQLRQHYIDSGKLRYYNRDFPQAMHRQAKYAAVAARCADAQGHYWPMFMTLFRHQQRLSAQIYPRLAREVGLEPGPLTDCLTDHETIKKIDSDFRYGQSLDVSTPPTFFVGTLADDRLHDVIRLTGHRPYAEFASVIDVMLAIDAAHTAMKHAHEEKLAARQEIARLEKALRVYK